MTGGDTIGRGLGKQPEVMSSEGKRVRAASLKNRRRTTSFLHLTPACPSPPGAPQHPRPAFSAALRCWSPESTRRRLRHTGFLGGSRTHSRYTPSRPLRFAHCCPDSGLKEEGHTVGGAQWLEESEFSPCPSCTRALSAASSGAVIASINTDTVFTCVRERGNIVYLVHLAAKAGLLGLRLLAASEQFSCTVDARPRFLI